jgi:processive 1,2-diacylglycerol beta-glucosyltransferase
LALAGATQPGPYARFKESLAVSLPSLSALPGTTIVVVTGRDDSFAAQMRQRVEGFGATNVRVLGYERDMASVMAAADLAVSKSGGLVTAECVSAGLPMVLIGPAAGQERANTRALTNAGAAVYTADPARFAAVVRKTLSRDGQLSRMHEATVALQHPGAALGIAERVLRLARAE